MNKRQLHIIVENVHNDIYSSSSVKVPDWAEMSIETVLGFYTDFDYNCLVKKDLVSLLPATDLKLYFNLCYFPDASPNIWINDKKTIDTINNDNNSYLWMYSPHEATFRPDELYEVIDKSGIKKEKIIFTCSSEEYNNKIVNGLKFVSVPEWWEAQYRHHLKHFSDVSFITPEEKNKTIDTANKKALTLNRNLKGHRLWWYQSLLDTKLIDDSYVSYHIPSIAKSENYTKDSLEAWIRNECRKMPSNLIEKIVNEPRIYQDRKLDEPSDQVIWHSDSVLPYYHDSLISIITESLDVENFLTEKTFKAIVHCHPFILVGNPAMNESLRARGYKTFESFFGMETIQTYEDAVTLIRTLEKRPLDNFKYLIKNKYWEFIEHNWNNFMTRKISWKPIEDKLLRATS